jgi:hypothetical protein
VDNASSGMRMASSACWDTPVPVVTVCMCGDTFTTVRGDDVNTGCLKGRCTELYLHSRETVMYLQITA